MPGAFDLRVLLIPILTLGAIGFVSFVNEGTIIDWGVIYLQDAGGIAPSIAILAFVANALGMLTARLLGDRMVTITGPVPMVRWAGVTTAVALGCVILRPEPVVAIVAYARDRLRQRPGLPHRAQRGRQPGARTNDGGQLGRDHGLPRVGGRTDGHRVRCRLLGHAGRVPVPVAPGSLLVVLAPVVRDAARGSRPATVSPAELPPL